MSESSGCAESATPPEAGSASTPLIEVWLLRAGESATLKTAVNTGLSRVLGARLGLRSEQLVFDRRCLTCGAPDGKPRLRHPEAPDFNVSHSESVAILAVASRPVGVDIERMRKVNEAALAARYFAPAERAALHRLQGDARRTLFFELWTRKEAAAKATGDGYRHGYFLKRDYSGALPFGWSPSPPESGPVIWTRRVPALSGFCAAIATTQPSDVLLRCTSVDAFARGYGAYSTSVSSTAACQRNAPIVDPSPP